MSSILTNSSAMVALQTLKSINSNLETTQSEISTGKSVASAKDNSAVWAISKVMEADVNGFSAISDSLSLGESTVAVARQASETVTDLLTQMKGKIVAAQEENVDREKIQTDINALRDQISSVVGAAQFNGLNMVQGTEDVNVLSSLDRASDGSVNASNITVARQDLSSDAGVYGNGGTDLSGNIVISSTNSAIDSSAAARDLDLTFAGAGTDDVDFSIGGTSFTETFDTNVNTTVDNLADSINALGLTGISAASNGSGVLTLTNTNSFDDSAITWDVGGTNTVAITNNGDSSEDATAASGPGSATLVYRAEDIALSTTAQVNEGDSYRISVNGNNYDYIAGAGETMEDVANGLKTAVDGGAETGVTTQVVQDGTTGAWTVQVDYDGTDTTAGATMALAINGEDGGTASGGMFGLDNIDVTSDSGASAALGNIETLINNSIDAAAAFGSAAGRIEIQSEFIGKLTDSLKTGIGSLVDADMEAASARLQALQVQQQLGTQALSIANQAPQNILSLFR
ncbi:flagellin [Maritimibacter sp. UBA3975]|uniref:flagellin N-terminal helical domain-containing protein n=1 Tax=Maritimibacter sp. UBA3975 TaxID=1946833 RepID=UPI000C0AA9DA|nr:flagellin [Maritimibacter sp. UBA3975]MAM61839.1 flagellin [Maritimibacter sp.]